MDRYRVRVVGISLLLALFGIASGQAAAVGWREKVAPSLLALVDQRVEEERPVLVVVDLEGAGAGGPLASDYALASHRISLDLVQAGSLATLKEWTGLEPPLVSRQAGQDLWEKGTSYVHQWRGVLVQVNVRDLPALAAVGFVIQIVDASGTLPLALPTLSESASGPAGAATPTEGLSALLAGKTVPVNDLLRWIEEQRWAVVDAGTASALAVEALAPLVPGSSSLTGSAYSVAALALPSSGAATSGFLEWILSSEGSVGAWKGLLSRSQLYLLLDGLLMTGADLVTASQATYSGKEFPIYLFWRAVDSQAIASLGSIEAPVARVPGPPAPQTPFATKGSHDDHVTLEWESVPGAEGYEILRAPSSEGVYELEAIQESNAFKDYGVTTCRVEWYRVRPFDAQGPGGASPSVSGYIGLVPQAVPATWVSLGEAAQGVRIEWTGVPEAAQYVVVRTEYMTGSTNRYAKLYTIGTTSDTFLVDQDVIAGQTYIYRVRGANACGGGELGKEAIGSALFVATSTDTAQPPSWVDATRGKPYDRVQVSWTRVPGAVEYQVFRAADYAAPYTLAATTSSTYWEDTDAGLCENYWYRVVTVGKSGASGQSATVHGSCGDKPASPGSVTATRNIHTDSIALAWAPVVMASYYQVARAPAAAGPYATIATTSEPAFIDMGLDPCQRFWYKIRATNLCGTSGYSAIVEGSTFCK